MTAPADAAAPRGATVEHEGLEVVFARELPAPGRGDTEAFARLRVEHFDAGRRLRWRRDGAATLGRAVEAWPLEPLPQVLDDALERFADSGPPRVWLSAELQSWLAAHAPRTFRTLSRRSVLFQRDPCYAIVRDDDAVRLAWRPDGPVRAEAREAPLFAVAHALARGRLPGRAASDDAAVRAAVRLVRAHLLAHWSTGRPAPEVRWVPAEGGFRLRAGGPDALLVEGADGGRAGARLVVPDLGEPLELDLTAPPGVPAPVVRAGLEWLLAGAALEGGELFVDPSGAHVRELG